MLLNRLKQLQLFPEYCKDCGAEIIDGDCLCGKGPYGGRNSTLLLL